MSYENLKTELLDLVEKNYRDGTPINDVRAAIRAVDLMAEQLGAIQLLEIAKSMADKNDD